MNGDDVSKALTNMGQALEQRDKQHAGLVRRLQRRTYILIASVLIDISLTAFGGYLYVKVNDNVSCTATQKISAAELHLWTYAFALPPASPQTPAQKKNNADFLRYIHTQFGPVRC